MIYLSDSVRRQLCARLGPIILFKLEEDKGKVNLLRRWSKKKNSIVNTFCHSESFMCRCQFSPSAISMRFQ